MRTVVLTGADNNFSSGGDVFEIIEPLTKMAMPDLLDFTRMTGDLVRQMRACPQPIIAAVDGICAGAGAILAMAADFRIATPQTKTAFLFTRVGLAGADMGACGILPRIIGQGRASELLFTGRVMTAAEGHAWGFYNALHERGDLLAEARRFARTRRRRPVVRAYDDQEDARPGMGHGHRPDHRVGSAGAGDLHGDRRLPPRLRGLRRQDQTRLQGELTDGVAWHEHDAPAKPGSPGLAVL